jgi:hypothetical protein
MKLKIEFSKSLIPKSLGKGIEPILYPSKKSFIPKWLYINQILPSFKEAQVPKIKKNLWGFRKYWTQVAETYSTHEELYASCAQRVEAIRQLKEAFHLPIETFKNLNPLYSKMVALSKSLTEQGTFCVDSSTLVAIKEASSGFYLWVDKHKHPHFIVRPLDEGRGCLHNPKGEASPFEKNSFDPFIPLYSSCLRETFTYFLAKYLGLESMVPQASLGILQSDRFFSLSDQISLSELSAYTHVCGSPDREKLCSIQEFVHDSKTLKEAISELSANGLTMEEIASRIDPADFEAAHILLWITHPSDGEQFLVYPKGADSIGNEVLGLKKIGNDSLFPTRNRNGHSPFRHFPNTHLPLSKEARTKISRIDTERLVKTMNIFGLGSATEAFQKRISLLKKWVSQNLTLQEIDAKFSFPIY